MSVCVTYDYLFIPYLPVQGITTKNIFVHIKVTGPKHCVIQLIECFSLTICCMLLSNFSTVAWRKEAGLITALPNKKPAWVTFTELSFSHKLASSG